MKRKMLWRASFVVVVAGLLVCVALMWRPAIAPLSEPFHGERDSIARGAKIAAQGDCAVCHTAPGGAYMAGNLPLVTPFGTLYTVNITSDKNTGIGSWSSEAFSRAMRKGISRDGHFLYPAFPYVHYSQMAEHDLSDLYAYLMSVDPVASTAPDNQMMFPMGFRPLVAFWNLLFLRGHELKDVPGQTAEWNRGRYLVEGPGHCSSCHSPLNLIGGEKGSQLYSGGRVDNWNAPALIAMTGKSAPWNKDQLVAYLRGEIANPQGAAAGPMLPVSLSLAELPVADVEAIATYVLDLKGEHLNAAGPECSAVTTATSASGAGAALFAGACAQCHGEGAPMRTQGARPGLVATSALTSDSSQNLIQTILQGIPLSTRASSHYMPAFADTLTDAHISALATYLRSVSCPARPWTDLDTTIATIRREGASK